eukprot:UN33050
MTNLPSGFRLNLITDLFSNYTRKQNMKRIIVKQLQSQAPIDKRFTRDKVQHVDLKRKIRQRKSVSKRVTQWLPGLCTGEGGMGVGCGYMGNEMELFGVTVTPTRPL